MGICSLSSGLLIIKVSFIIGNDILSIPPVLEDRDKKIVYLLMNKYEKTKDITSKSTCQIRIVIEKINSINITNSVNKRLVN